MHVVPRRRARLAFSLLGIVALLTVCAGTAAAHVSKKPKTAPKKVTITGTWSGSYSGAFSGTFTLHWTLTKGVLHGSITLSNPGGKYPINGSVSGTTINFGAVGAGATYTGKVSGKSMSGKYKTAQGGGSWSAKKS
jgi:hypothetical protein